MSRRHETTFYFGNDLYELVYPIRLCQHGSGRYVGTARRLDKDKKQFGPRHRFVWQEDPRPSAKFGLIPEPGERMEITPKKK